MLVLVRHGQSLWNLENRFTGWVDIDLSEEGEDQARKAGRLLHESGFQADRAYTSYLRRAIRTLWMILEETDRCYVPVEKDWRLNERHYGSLAGLNKAETIERYGEEQVHIWRRSYETNPPALEADDPSHPRFDDRYALLPEEFLPASESLAMTYRRAVPYFQSMLEPFLCDGKNLLVVAHGNSLRALVKYLFRLADDAITQIEIPTGNPLVLDFEPGSVTPVSAGYLDESRAESLPS